LFFSLNTHATNQILVVFDNLNDIYSCLFRNQYSYAFLKLSLRSD